MMKRLVSILAVIPMFSMLAGGALAGSCIRISSPCSVRSGPGLECAVLGSVGAGSTLDYTGGTRCDGWGVAWYSVRSGYGDGWVSSRYASFAGYDPTCKEGYVEAIEGDASVRSGPGLGYAAVGRMKCGCSARFTGEVSYDDRGVAWYRISLGHNTGWVSSRYTAIH